MFHPRYVNRAKASLARTVLPAELREHDQIRNGTEFDVERVQAGEYLLKRVSGAGSGGVLDWLRACPERDWFQSVPSESTDEL